MIHTRQKGPSLIRANTSDKLTIIRYRSHGTFIFTPIDLEASREAQREVLYRDRAFSVKKPAYFRTDLKINFRVNQKKLTHEWSLDIQNLFNTQNIFHRTYNPLSRQIVESYQLGFLPIPQYRLTF